ncbi:acyl-CoA dehydratase activase [uncultured Ruminococcus sp.]|uniref:acyl-CoA dehydratase activase n=1 Tax=uncultured Ruminococcus sp. TaxID=165186 RepID=UPI002622CC87|nr:acyl-CoA dehydratase activase [uncultured Ruminococcus sp.]
MSEIHETPYALGIDVGSTTVKTVLLTEEGQVLSSSYERHFSKVRETVCEKLAALGQEYPETQLRVSITGSAGLGLAQAAKLPFVQEVHAAFLAVKQRYPEADVVIELGGEDAKIIFLTGGVEQRMNGSCAGGTGAFIDQMATLLDVSVDQLDKMALSAEKVYPIASRCGVFAKSDIQPLLNQGARREDIAASIFQAVVDQTVSGLAQGRRIQGNVLFLGGPLSFLQGLRNAFTKTLGLDEAHAHFPEDGRTFVAYGSALSAAALTETYTLEQLGELLRTAETQTALVADKPLFSYPEEYQRFQERHAAHDVARGDYRTYKGKAYLGIDAGSTTTKMVLLSENHELLYDFYASNKGQPLDCVKRELTELYEGLSPDCTICGSAVTGYGEDLIRAGLGIDFGIVETVAHFKAASFFCPDVDFIIDIGGQDIKCFQIKNGSIDSIMLNEACSSGCGSFIQAFAVALGYDIAEFSKLGLFAEHPVDLGSRCTVFMNSSVKQAQKDGATVEDISAGLSGSIVKNAIYKVIRAHNPEDLGQHIVVQGGTFLNDAVLRCFEREIGQEVIRPAISGLMGAFGAALYAQEKSQGTSTLLSPEQLREFSYTAKATTCKGCTAHCALSIIRFNDGSRFISGNRCEKGAGKKESEQLPNLFEWKYRRILSLAEHQPEQPKATVGLPLALHYYDQMPLWHTFFTDLGFAVKFSEESTRDTYYKGQSTIPSDTVCYPAKITHGHIESLLEQGVDFIFYPCMSYNIDEGDSDNHYNCPVVAYYPELLMANCEKLTPDNFLYPFLDLNRRSHVVKTLHTMFGRYASKKEVEAALEHGFAALEQYRKEVISQGEEIVRLAREANKKIIVLAGRPYHMDPEINHGIHKLIGSLGLAVITEDSVAHLAQTPQLQALNQWTYHSRMYRAAQYVTTQPDMQLVQLVSFGCGIDAITTDEVRRILEDGGKLYTQLKIDEISNLGAIKIRLRSLIAAME